jgi:ArsR family transcriptional regulator
MYKALSEDMRLRIVMLLARGEICVCDLMAIFGESQSKVSRHLAYLKHSGLVKSRRLGTWMHYSLKEPLDGTIDAQVTFMKQYFSQLPIFRDDEQKMQDIKKQKLCEEDAAKAVKNVKLRIKNF